MFTSTEYAYLAGLIDGDGCLKASRGGANGKGRTLHIEVASRYEASIDYLVGTFGGNKTVTSTPQGRPFFRWRVGSTWMRDHLEEIMPYLGQMNIWDRSLRGI